MHPPLIFAQHVIVSKQEHAFEQSPQVVNSASPYRTMGDFVAAARAKPGELTLSSTGPATNSHISFENFKRTAKVSITYVPFPGNAPTVNAVLGGHVTVGIANYADLVGHFQAVPTRRERRMLVILATANR